MSAAGRPEPMSGLLLVDKPTGMTSHDVVSRVRRIFGQREVGHTGTLDPMATGLLVLALGNATRVARFIEAKEKHYEGTVQLGVATDSYDADGQVTERAPVPALARERVEAVLAALVGPMSQSPPPFSAVKVEGERLYKKARRGEGIEGPPRTIEVYDLSLAELREDALEIRARVSKGTYVRSLAVAIGHGLELPAHLSRLRRTAVGQLLVSEARPLDALEGRPEELRAIETVLGEMPKVRLDAHGLIQVGFGKPPLARWIRPGLEGSPAAGDPVLLLDPEGRAAALGFTLYDAKAMAGVSESTQVLKYACVLRR